MKFVLSTKDLCTLVAQCSGAISPKPTSPILNNFLLQAEDNLVTLTATDLTVAVRCTVPAKVLAKGVTTLPAKKFGSLVRELTSLNVEISTNEQHLTEICADSSVFKIKGISPLDYPDLPNMSDAVQIKFTQAQLYDLLYRTVFAVSREDKRYALMGVLFQVNKGRVTCFGTDGKRLSRCFISLPVDESFTARCIIPTSAVEEMIRSLAQTDEEAIVSILPDKVALQSGNTTIITKLLAGDYPDLDRIIPASTETTICLHREELTTLLRQISLFMTDSAQSVKFAFHDGELRLASNNSDLGEGKVGMTVNYTGPLIEIAFNPLFFLDVLRHTKGETVSIGLIDSYNPGVITDVDYSNASPRDLSTLFVLMPMRLAEA